MIWHSPGASLIRKAYHQHVAKKLLLAAIFCAALPVLGQYSSDQQSMGQAAQQIPAYLKHTGIEQHLNHPLPLNAVFTDDQGATAPLAHWIGKSPVILVLMYYKCRSLCPEVLNGLAAGLKDSHLKPGKDYKVITVSIDPSDTPSDALPERTRFVRNVGLPGIDQATHFLTGNEASIQAISDATGFRFVRIPGPDGKMDQFAHPTVLMFATPDGRLSKYIAGVQYPSTDLRLAVLDASERRISNPADLVLLYCCSYNPVSGKYSVAILRVLSIAGLVTLFVVGGMIWLLTRKPQSRASV
jgi:protein SCO1